MTDQPQFRQFGAELYQALEPLAYADEENDWALAYLVRAFATIYNPIADIVRDTDDGPGWSIVLDIDRVPDEWLDWLAQMNGTVLPTGIDLVAKRELIRDEPGFRRGTPGSILAAAKRHLTGTKRVTLTERFASAYNIGLITYTAETPDQAAVLAEVLKVKPAGLTLTYDVYDGWVIQEMEDYYPSPATLAGGPETDFDTLEDFEQNLLGGGMRAG